jgi:hypothetical protein
LELPTFAKLVSDNPRREFVDAIDGMLSNARQYEAQIRLRSTSLRLCGADQALDHGSTFTTRVIAGEQIVATTERHAAQYPLDRRVVNLQLPITAIARERLPTDSTHRESPWLVSDLRESVSSVAVDQV